MATIESLVVKISGDATNLKTAVDSARSSLRSLGSVGGIVAGVFASLGQTILNSVKREAFSKIKQEFKAFGEGIFEGIETELQRLGESLANFLLGGNRGAVERFQNRIITWLNNIIALARQFVEGMDLGRVLGQVQELGRSIARMADALTLLALPFKALQTAGTFLGETAARGVEATRNPTTALGAGRSVIELLRGLLERSTEQTTELKTQTNELRELEPNARFG